SDVTGPEAPGRVNEPVGEPWSSSAGYGSPKERGKAYTLAAFSESALIETNATPLGCSSFASLDRCGASAWQWGHHVANSSSSTGFPRKSDRLTVCPWGVFSVKPGASVPGFSRAGVVGGRAALAGSFSSTPTPGSVVVWKPIAAAARFSAAGALRSAADVVCAGGGGAGGCERRPVADSSV